MKNLSFLILFLVLTILSVIIILGVIEVESLLGWMRRFLEATKLPN